MSALLPATTSVQSTRSMASSWLWDTQMKLPTINFCLPRNLTVQVNGLGGLTVGWTRFDSLAEALGTQHVKFKGVRISIRGAFVLGGLQPAWLLAGEF